MALGVDKEKANAFEGEARELAEQLERHGAQTEYLKVNRWLCRSVWSHRRTLMRS